MMLMRLELNSRLSLSSLFLYYSSIKQWGEDIDFVTEGCRFHVSRNDTWGKCILSLTLIICHARKPNKQLL